MRILVTGGAGFIGSHLVDALVARGEEVVIVDSLDPQVHPHGVPQHLNRNATFIEGNLLDSAVLDEALEGCEAVFHQAACVGTAQSQYQFPRYVEQNTLATARLLDAITRKQLPLQKLIVASSMASYGEGASECDSCGPQLPPLRTAEDLGQTWEPPCPHCRQPLRSVLTGEAHPRRATTVYALTKQEQEELVRVAAQTYDIPAVALRYFNVYGPRQSLSNPYTGVVAIFLSRLRCGQAPTLYEDGEQTRDFVSVHDIVQANLRALDSDVTWGAYNVGGGQRISIREIAETLATVTEIDIPPTITEQFRKGDVRHCCADISAIVTDLGYAPSISIADGIAEVVQWSSAQESIADHFQQATSELEQNGILESLPKDRSAASAPPQDRP